MALPKRVKVGGSYYKGYTLPVSSTVGGYVLVMAPSTTSFAVNGMSITPSSAGAGDYFGVTHVTTTGASGGTVISTLAETVYNIGGGISIMLDFATLELVEPGHSLRFVYTNTATQAMSVVVALESIR